MGEMLNKEKVNQILAEHAEKAKQILNDKDDLIRMLVEAEKTIKAHEELSSIQDLPAMIHIVRSYAYGTASGVSEDSAAVMAGALMYLMDSEDYFQDSTPVIGLFDDMAVIWAAIDREQKVIRSFGK